ncbi:MAG: ribonuclease P [Methanomicrobiaceae archaeon]|nr:ribonuclease P [Methanomicrobiaceae archaeon]
MAPKGKNTQVKRIARERIEALFHNAGVFFRENPALSDRYVALARRISMRQRIPIPRILRRQYCRRCYGYLVPGINLRVRVHNGHVIATCLRCGYQRRYRVVRPHR